MFPVEHSFFGNTSCTNLCRFLQVDSAYSKTPVEHILQHIHHAHLHDKCMITVFCHQIIFVVNKPHKIDLATIYTAPKHHSMLLFLY